MQYVFTLPFAHSVCCLADISSSVAVCMVLYQKLPTLLVLMKEDSTEYKHITYTNTAALVFREAHS